MLRVPPEFLVMTDHELVALIAYLLLALIKILVFLLAVYVIIKVLVFIVPNYWARGRRNKKNV